MSLFFLTVLKIPYENDCRTYSIPTFDFLAGERVTVSSASASDTLPAAKRVKPSNNSSKNHPLDTRTGSKQQVMDAFDSLIHSMSLDSDYEHYWPKHVPNPTMQRLDQCRIHRGLYPDSQKLPLDLPKVAELLEPCDRIREASRPVIETLKSLFTLKLLPKRPVKGRVKRSMKRKAVATGGGSDSQLDFLFEDTDPVVEDVLDDETVVESVPALNETMAVKDEKVVVEESKDALDFLFD